jgi:CheY-like chemotaxis protein
MCPIVPPDGRRAGEPPAAGDPAPEFAQLVRSALAHVYDYSYLQNHPLAVALDTARDHDQVTRAQALRRVLLDAIAALKPPNGVEMAADRARSYALLTSRYLDGMSIEAIADELGLSRRHAFRELDKGVQAVASLLWERIAVTDSVSDVGQAAEGITPPNRAVAAQVEVERLRHNLHLEHLDARQLLEGILDVAAPLAQKRGVKITLVLENQPLGINADRVMLRQALLNLVSHALDEGAGANLVVRIGTDHGGIVLEVLRALEAAPLCFAVAPSDGGSPVGVSVALGLVQAQRGRLSIHHDAAGWAARVTLPASGGPAILVIDDNADLVGLFQRYLAGHDVSLVGATNSTQALRLAEELRPQLLILDLMMPSQDGWEILGQLRASPATRDIPIVICSVLDEHEMALASGASDYLVKPVNQVDLLAVLRRWLGALRPIA